MDKVLQQRLVGAIALVALGVIFIPVLLDGSGYKSRHERVVEIPDKPSFPPLSQTTVKPIATPIDLRKEEVEKRKKTEPAKPIQSWALQVGTFGNKSNANAFRDKLRKAGHSAYVESSKSDGKTSYRVRIGPELQKERLEKLKARLKKEQKIDGFVVNHP
jgi:DedD protein